MKKTLASMTMIVMLALPVGTATARPDHAGPGHAVPISEHLAGQMTGIDEADPFPVGSTFGGRCSVTSNYVIRFEGAGTVSHLGEVTWRSEHCTQYFDLTATDGVLTIVAANGDTLVQHYGATIQSATESTKLASFAGGDGRFAGAEGEITSSSVWYPDTLTFTHDGYGWIQYDASARSNH